MQPNYDPRVLLSDEHCPRISDAEVMLNIHFWRETPVNRWSMEGRSGDFNVFRYDPLSREMLLRRLAWEQN